MGKEVRSVAFVGHNSCGKTTLAEAVLFKAGAIPKMGSVEKGNTVSDFLDVEREQKASLRTSVMGFEKDGVAFYIVDTPGYADFWGEVISATKAVDCLLIVVDAVMGAEVQTERAWQLAKEYNIPVVFVVNKMDKERANFEAAVKSLKEALEEKSIVPVLYPIGAERDFKGLYDIVEGKVHGFAGEPPEEEVSPIKERASSLIEDIIELDEELVEKYLESGEVSPQEVKEVLRRGIAERKIFPVVAVSAEKALGIEELLSFVKEYVPSPKDRGPWRAKDANTGQEVEVAPDESAPFSGFVFKVVVDPYVGKQVYVRVVSGKLVPKVAVKVLSPDGKPADDRITRFYRPLGKETKDLEEAYPGEIVVVSKVEAAKFGSTICDPEHPVIFEPPRFPEPLASFSIRAANEKDDPKMGEALGRLAEEDPAIRFWRNEDTKETMISGLGDQHVELIVSLLKSKFKVDAVLGKPLIAYRETIKGTARAEGKYKHQTGGRGQYGHVFLLLEPLERGKGFEFVNKIVGGVVPKQYIPAVEKGVRDTMAKGVLAGYPVVDVRVTLYDGSYHEVDSSDWAFQIASSMAFKKAFMDAKPVLLEPIVDVEVIVPSDNVGDVIGEINARRGRVTGLDQHGKKGIVRAKVPQAEMFGFGAKLKSLTGGRGTFTMRFSHYEEVPPQIAEKIIEERKAQQTR